MDGTVERIARLVLAAVLIPALGWMAYMAARYANGDPGYIDDNGSGIGVLLIMASVFVVSRVASPDGWSERAGASLALSAAYFFVTWLLFGDTRSSLDDSPHLVWYGACVAAFSPSVVLTVASKWAWETFRERRADFYSPDKTSE